MEREEHSNNRDEKLPRDSHDSKDSVAERQHKKHGEQNRDRNGHAQEPDSFDILRASERLGHLTSAPSVIQRLIRVLRSARSSKFQSLAQSARIRCQLLQSLSRPRTFRSLLLQVVV